MHTYRELTDALERAIRVMRVENWCTSHMAVDENGCSIAADDPRARRWCAAGHVLHECSQMGFDEAELDAVYHRALPELGFHGAEIAKINDARSVGGMEPARDMLRAIAREARKRGDDALPNPST